MLYTHPGKARVEMQDSRYTKFSGCKNHFKGGFPVTVQISHIFLCNLCKYSCTTHKKYVLHWVTTDIKPNFFQKKFFVHNSYTSTIITKGKLNKETRKWKQFYHFRRKKIRKMTREKKCCVKSFFCKVWLELVKKSKTNVHTYVGRRTKYRPEF